ncbi:MAG: glutaredoxin family protein [Gammaproteobacteria bacterium]
MSLDLEFVIYSKAGCHLCDVMLEDLQDLIDDSGAGLTVVDIAGSEELTGRYGDKIPVLTADGVELCRYRLDARRVRDWMIASSEENR